MNKTGWERRLTKKVEIVNAAGGLQVIHYSIFARIEWTGTEWPDNGFGRVLRSDGSFLQVTAGR
jgi:hypothetical protein